MSEMFGSIENMQLSFKLQKMLGRWRTENAKRNRIIMKGGRRKYVA